MPATVPQIARTAFFDAHPMLKDVYELPAAVNALLPNDALMQAGIRKRVRVELCTDRAVPANLQVVLFEADTADRNCRSFSNRDVSYLVLDNDNQLVTFTHLNGDKYAHANYPALGTNNVDGLAAYAMKKLFSWAGPAESMAMLAAIENASKPAPSAPIVLPVVAKTTRRGRGTGVGTGGTSRP